MCFERRLNYGFLISSIALWLSIYRVGMFLWRLTSSPINLLIQINSLVVRNAAINSDSVVDKETNLFYHPQATGPFATLSKYPLVNSVVFLSPAKSASLWADKSRSFPRLENKIPCLIVPLIYLRILFIAFQ